MSKQQPGAHLALEDMAAMIDGNLGSDERDALVHHLAECRACREELAEYARAESGLDASARRFGRTPALVWMSVAATLTIATVAGVVVLRRQSPTSDVPPDTQNAPAPVAAPAPTPVPRPPSPPTREAPEDLTTRRSGTREIGGKTFRLVAGEWIDTAYDSLALLPTEHVEPSGRDDTLMRVPALKPYAALGPRFVVVLDGTVYRFGPR